jgi:hypothetical protein
MPALFKIVSLPFPFFAQCSILLLTCCRLSWFLYTNFISFFYDALQKQRA